MKGFKVPTTVFKLTFEDEQYAGLVIKAKSLPLREFLALQDGKAGNDAEMTRKFIGKLAGAITEWNLEDDDGNPIEVSEESLSGLELGFVLTIIEAWMGAVASVPKHLSGNLNGTGTSPMPSIPMALS